MRRGRTSWRPCVRGLPARIDAPPLRTAALPGAVADNVAEAHDDARRRAYQRGAVSWIRVDEIRVRDRSRRRDERCRNDDAGQPRGASHRSNHDLAAVLCSLKACDLPPVRGRRPRVRVVSDRRRRHRRSGGHRSRILRSSSTSKRRRARKFASCACSRRTRMRTIYRATAVSHSTTAAESTSTRRREVEFAHELARRRRRRRRRRGLDPDDPHAGPPAGTLLLRRQRPHRSDEPWLVLTGDSLFVGDAARPDLAIEARAGAEGLFHSLRRLAELPDGVEVYPGHVAGSLCGAGMSSKASSTIGFERRFNHAMTITTEDDVRRGVRRRLAAAPAEHGANRRAEPWAVRRRRRRRSSRFAAQPTATIVDVRDADSFAVGHAHGAINVPIDGSSFSTKSAFLHVAGRVDRHPRVERRRGGTRGARAACGRAARHRRLHARPAARRAARADRSSTRSSACSPPARSRCSTCARRTSATAATSRERATSRTGCSASATTASARSRS